jgi:pyruvate ferredoxin oxidoreductase gamma subunit
MLEVRIHGRGGQGVVTAAELLSVAAFIEGRFAQAFPSFGSERMGAPVVSYCRIDDHPIRTREPVMEPGALIVQDATLIHEVDLFAGLQRGAHVLVNTSRSAEDLGLGELADRFFPGRLITCPATEIALEQLGRPLANAALLGAFAALTQAIGLGVLHAALRERFAGAVGEQNVAAATVAYRFVTLAEEDLARAAAD